MIEWAMQLNEEIVMISFIFKLTNNMCILFTMKVYLGNSMIFKLKVDTIIMLIYNNIVMFMLIY